MSLSEIENEQVLIENPTTIFLLNYKFAHTLSQFMFNSVDLLKSSGMYLEHI